MLKQARPIPSKKLIVALTFFCLIGLLPALAAADLTPGTLDIGFNVGTGTDNAVLATCWGANGDGQAPALSLSPTGLPNGTIGQAYSQTISTLGGSGPLQL